MSVANSDVYTDSGRLRIADRLVRSLGTDGQSTVPMKMTAGIKVEWFDAMKLNTGDTYGYLPFALRANEDELKNAIQYCGARKEQFARYGDYFRAWLYGSRQALLAGVLTGACKVSMTKP